MTVVSRGFDGTFAARVVVFARAGLFARPGFPARAVFSARAVRFAAVSSSCSGVGSDSATVAGISATTSAAGLSRRNPLKAAWRIMPDPVQPANSISATSFGSSHRTLLFFGRRVLAAERTLSRPSAP